MLTVCATLPLLLLGAEVTTKQVGMVDPVGFRTPWHLFTVLDRAIQELGFLIEHSHRLVGFVVGMCATVLAIGLWIKAPSRGLRWLGVAAFLGISIQGLLGGFRVNLNAIMGKNLALIHGCFAQIVVALLASAAWVTSRSWLAQSGPTDNSAPDNKSIRQASLLTVALVFLQIVFGGIVRHRDNFFGARGHMLIAFAVAAAVVWLIALIMTSVPRDGRLARMAGLLGVLLVCQLFLGIESWMSRFGSPQWQQLQPLGPSAESLRSLHYLVGAFIFSCSVVVSLQAHRRWAWSGSPATVPQLEVAL